MYSPPRAASETPATRGLRGLLRRASTLVLPLAAALALPTFPLWLGLAHGRWDIQAFYFPAYSLLADAAREGSLLLWNPWVSGGRPELADPQIGNLSPVIVLAGLLFGGSLQGFSLYWLAIWLATGVGMALLARHLGAPSWGALIVGAGLMACGFTIGHAQHTSFLASFAYYPFVLWRLDVALQGRSRLAAAQTGALWGLSAVGGYPAMVLISGMVAGLWTLGRCFFGWAEVEEGERPARPRLRELMITAAIAGALALVMMAPTYAAYAVEARDFSDRTEPISRQRAITEGAMHPAGMASLLAPQVSLPRTRQMEVWGLYGFHMASIYLGVGSVLLALMALIQRPRSAFRWWLAGIALLFLGIALGPLLPLRGWVYDLVPPSRFFRHPMIFRAGFLIATAALAALGARDRDADPERWDRRLALLSLAATPVVALLLFLLRRSDAQFWEALPRAWAVLAVVFWVLPAALVWLTARLQRRHWRPALFAALALIEAAVALWSCRSILYSWSGMVHHARLEQGRQNLPADSFDQTARGWARRVESRFGVPNNRDSILREGVLRNYDPLSTPLLNKLAKLSLVATVTGPERLWFSPLAGVREADEPALIQLSRRYDALGGPSLLLHPRPGESPPAGVVPFDQLPAMQKVAVELLEFRPETLRFAVDLPAGGWLWVTERYAAGWQATVDGAPRPVWLANFFFRAIEVPAGRHEIAFRYRPFGHPWLLAISWLAAGALVVWTLIEARRVRATSNAQR